MTDRPLQVSPQVYARAGGLLYLVIFVMAAVSPRNSDSGDAVLI